VAWKRLENLDGVLKEGDEVEVKLLEIDQKTGKLRLSRKALMDKPEGYVERERPPRDRNDRGDRRDYGDRDRRYGGDRRDSDRRDRRR
jgi:polyribonucleotide nucleotidyltransferase